MHLDPVFGVGYGAMLLGDVVRELEALAPLRYAESWDNVGLLVGDPDRPCAQVMLTIDYTSLVAAEARDLGCDLVVSYHPPIFEGLKRVVAPGLVFEAIRDGIALYSPHTALDAAPFGTNDVLADLLGLCDVTPLKAAPDSSGIGIGRIGRLATPTSVSDLVLRIKQELGLTSVLLAGPEEGLVVRAAACAGACGVLLNEVMAQSAELYLTGELRHHDALRAAQAGVTVVCTLHSNSERKVLVRVKQRLEQKLPALRIVLSSVDRDPFTVR